MCLPPAGCPKLKAWVFYDVAFDRTARKLMPDCAGTVRAAGLMAGSAVLRVETRRGGPARFSRARGLPVCAGNEHLLGALAAARCFPPARGANLREGAEIVSDVARARERAVASWRRRGAFPHAIGLREVDAGGAPKGVIHRLRERGFGPKPLGPAEVLYRRKR